MTYRSSPKNLKNAFALAAIAATLLASPAYAFFNDESVKVAVPEQIPEGGIIPFAITLENFSSDPIKSVALIAVSNPEKFQQAMTLELTAPSSAVVVGGRLRAGTQGMLNTVVTVTRASGKTTTKQFSQGNVLKAVDFNNPDTLTTVFKGTFVFPTSEIGQPQKVARLKKGTFGVLELRGLLNHPMLPPSTDAPEGYYVHTVDISSNGAPIAKFSMTPALSNSPYLQLEIPSEAAPDSVTMTWKDTKGYSFTK